MILAFLASVLLQPYALPPPSANLAPVPNFTQTCADAGIQSAPCLVTTLDTIDYAHKKEGLGNLFAQKLAYLNPCRAIVCHYQSRANGTR